jgi:hypothetical protein
MADFNALIVSLDQKFCNEMVQMLRTRGIHAGAESEIGNAEERAETAKATHVFLCNEYPKGKLTAVVGSLVQKGYDVIVFVRDCADELPVYVKAQLQLAGIKSILMPPINATRIHRKLIIYRREFDRIKQSEDDVNVDGNGFNADSPQTLKQDPSTHNLKDTIHVTNKSKDQGGERFPLNKSLTNGVSERGSRFVVSSKNQKSSPKLVLPGGGSITKPEIQLVADALEATLAQWVQTHSPSVTQALSPHHNGSAVVVHTSKFSGIMVIANYVENRLQALGNVSEFRDYLQRELEQLGEGLEVRESFILPLQINNFRHLMANASEFAFEDIHNGVPLIVAVFDSEKVFPVLRAMEGDGMNGVSISEIEPGVKLDFDVYLHMPINKRFFRYVNTQRYLMPEQKERLVEKGGPGKEVFVSDEQVGEFKQYAASQFFKRGKAS